jgi:hypothetical protein
VCHTRGATPVEARDPYLGLQLPVVVMAQLASVVVPILLQVAVVGVPAPTQLAVQVAPTVMAQLVGHLALATFVRGTPTQRTAPQACQQTQCLQPLNPIVTGQLCRLRKLNRVSLLSIIRRIRNCCCDLATQNLKVQQQLNTRTQMISTQPRHAPTAKQPLRRQMQWQCFPILLVTLSWLNLHQDFMIRTTDWM